MVINPSGHGYIKLTVPQHSQEMLPKHCRLIKNWDFFSHFFNVNDRMFIKCKGNVALIFS